MMIKYSSIQVSRKVSLLLKRGLGSLCLVLMLVSCADENFGGNGVETGDVICFSNQMAPITRADRTGEDAADVLGHQFVVEGTRGNGHVEVFDHYNVNWIANTAGSTESNSSNWEYAGQQPNSLSSVLRQSVKYWDFSEERYDFLAFSKGSGTNNAVFSRINMDNLLKGSHDSSNAVYTISGNLSDLGKVFISDLVTVNKANFGHYPVTPRFHGIGAKIRMGIYETVPGYSVKDVMFYESDEAATSTSTACLYAETKAFPGSNSNGILRVFFPDNNGKAQTLFESTSSEAESTFLPFSALTYPAGKELKEEPNALTTVNYMGRTSNSASYAGINDAAHDNAYISILRNSNDEVELNLKVDYTLVPIDGTGDTYHVKGVTAKVPAEYTNWQNSYAYTYLFKISDRTSGLSPITFDAVVIDTEGGAQNTVTTVHQTTINTYQHSDAMLNSPGDKYDAGLIYVTVNDDRDNDGVYETVTLNPGIGINSDDNISLFVVNATGADAGRAIITEELVKKCYESESKANPYSTSFGPYRFGGNKYVTLYRVPDGLFTQTDKVPAEASPFGSDLNVSAASFYAKSDMMYAIQYRDRSGNTTYKLLNTNANGGRSFGYTSYLLDIYEDGETDDGEIYNYGIENNIADGAAFYQGDEEVEYDMDASRAASQENDGIITGTVKFQEGVEITSFQGVFDFLGSLMSIDLPSTLKELGDADDGCSNIGYNDFLTQIVMPKNVTYIGNYSFYYARGLQQVVLNEGLKEIGYGAFDGCEVLNDVIFPSTLDIIGECAFWSCANLSKVVLNEGLEDIEEYAFDGCALERLEIPSTVKSIGENAFSSNSESLKEIILPYSVGSIGKQAFSDNQNLETVRVDMKKDAITDTETIGIGGSAFLNCKILKDVTVPKNVNEIFSLAFGNCPIIENMIFLSETPPTVESNDIVDIFNTTEKQFPNAYLRFYVPDGTKDAYIDKWNVSSGEAYRIVEYSNAPAALKAEYPEIFGDDR